MEKPRLLFLFAPAFGTIVNNDSLMLRIMFAYDVSGSIGESPVDKIMPIVNGAFDGHKNIAVFNKP